MFPIKLWRVAPNRSRCKPAYRHGVWDRRSITFERLETRLLLASDWGDAPYPYPVLMQEDGARHEDIGPVLGTLRDAESDGQHSANADADANDDGVSIGSWQIGQSGATVTVHVENAPSGAKLDAWIDFDGNGSWDDPGDRIAVNLDVANGDNSIPFDVPTDAATFATFARFRLSSMGGLTPYGPADDGEVEDYEVTFTPQNLATNPGFESGSTSGWIRLGAGSLSTTAAPHSGSWSALRSGRTARWNGPAQQLNPVLDPYVDYELSVWVRLANGDDESFELTMRQTDDAGTRYHSIDRKVGTLGEWVQLRGGFTVKPTGNVTDLFLYVQGPEVGVDFYVDDLEVIARPDWKNFANREIEQHRKRDAVVTVVDESGSPLPGVEVEVRQTRHDFAFGSVINNTVLNNATYGDFFRDHFEWAVMENQTKWTWNEPSQGNVTYSHADQIIAFLEANDIRMRGHTLFWSAEGQVQQWVKNLSDAELEQAISSRISSAVTHFQGRFEHWDVNNEMLHNHFYEDRLGPQIRTSMFQQAAAVDPNVVLFVNEFNVLSHSATEDYKRQIEDLIASGAPVGAIGVQGHMGSPISPASVRARLDLLAELGLPIWITEFDVSDPDVASRADQLEALYRTVFSHPAVEGIFMWGFWEGSIYRGPDAALVDLNWTVNAAGQRYEGLIDEWTTSTSGVTAADGTMLFRGFHGPYELTVKLPTGEVLHQEAIALPAGTDAEAITVTVPAATTASIAGRHLAYRGSSFDVSGDIAFAPDKSPLRTGEQATSANYTSYDRGINRIVVDIYAAAEPAMLGSADFEFRSGNSDDPAAWTPASAATITVALGVGPAGSDRVMIDWPDHAIENQWVEVKVKASSVTGLASDDVFYFGSAPGESGDSEEHALVNGTDFIAARDNAANPAANPAGIANRFDYNRDNVVDGTDMAIARDYDTNFSTALRLISPAVVPPPAPLPLVFEQDTSTKEREQEMRPPVDIVHHSSNGTILSYEMSKIRATAVERHTEDRLARLEHLDDELLDAIVADRM